MNHLMDATQNNPVKTNHISDLLLTRLDGTQYGSAMGKGIYLIEGVLICIMTFLWLEYAEMGKLYHWLFPIIVGSIIGSVHYVMTALILKFQRAEKITIGKYWLISFIGIVFSFIVAYGMGLCGIVCVVLGSYCPVSWHTSVPSVTVIFFKTVLMPMA